MAKQPLSLSPEHYHLSLAGRYEYAKHVVNIVWVLTGKKPDIFTLQGFTYLIAKDLTILQSAYEDARWMVNKGAYK